jgi:hypothetical protein
MHPIERLRMVARSGSAGPTLLAREAIGALAGFAAEPSALVTGCRRLVDRHLEVGPIWWLAARILTAGDPGTEIHRTAAELDDDDTAGILAAELPGDLTAVVVGWPEHTAQALRHRGDVEVLVVDFDGEGEALARRLSAAGVDAWDVPASGVAAAAVVSGLVVVEAVSAGPSGLLAAPGSHAAAAVARQSGTPVWAVAGTGRVLPGRLWDAQLERLDSADDEPWERAVELVPLSLVDRVIGPEGGYEPAELAGRSGCPVAAELLRPARA